MNTHAEKEKKRWLSTESCMDVTLNNKGQKFGMITKDNK